MAKVHQRGKTFYYVIHHRNEEGKYAPIRKGGFKTKKEATIAGAEKEIELDRGIDPKNQKVPFETYFKEWVEIFKNKKVSKSTQTHYEYTYAAISDYFLNKPLQQIKRTDYQRFLNNFGENRSKETVYKVHGHIKACVKDAIENQLIQIDFTRKTEPYWTKTAKKPAEKHLDYEETKRLIHTLKSKKNDGLGYSLLLLAVISGMRFGELVGLTRDDFNFKNGTVTVNKTWGYQKKSQEGFGPTKNEQSNRTIEISPSVMTHFKKLFLSTTDNPHHLVFFSPTSKYKVISNTNANKLLQKLLKELEIEPITVHGLRHTHASVSLYCGNSIQYVSERLGHSDIETTLKKYTHMLKEHYEKDKRLNTKIYEDMLA